MGIKEMIKLNKEEVVTAAQGRVMDREFAADNSAINSGAGIKAGASLEELNAKFGNIDTRNGGCYEDGDVNNLVDDPTVREDGKRATINAREELEKEGVREDIKKMIIKESQSKDKDETVVSGKEPVSFVGRLKTFFSKK